MLVSNIDDMKYAMRRAQRDTSCVYKEFFEYKVHEGNTIKFCIICQHNHSNTDDGYICTWSFGKSQLMADDALIVRLVENREQSFDNVAKIALSEIDNAFTTKRYEIKLRRNSDINFGVYSEHIYATDLYDALIKLENRHYSEFDIKTDLLSISRED